MAHVTARWHGHHRDSSSYNKSENENKTRAVEKAQQKWRLWAETWEESMSGVTPQTATRKKSERVRVGG